MEMQTSNAEITPKKDPPVSESNAVDKDALLRSSGHLKLKPLRDGLKELENAYELMRASRTAYREKIAAVAEKSGVEPSVIRAFVATRMIEDSEKADRKAAQARQLVLVFEEVGG
mgnify:CR=1 FL=1